MTQLLFGRASEPRMDGEALRAMFSLRHRVFRQKLGWKVTSLNGEERDDYDRLDPLYMVSLADGRAHGCWRLLPTTGPYMLRDTFPELLRGEKAPEDAGIWEVSRFAITSPGRRQKGQIVLSDIAFEMFAQLIDFVDENAYGECVTVTSTAFERLMKSNGITLRRFGDGAATDVGGVESVACWIPLDARTRSAIGEATSQVRTA